MKAEDYEYYEGEECNSVPAAHQQYREWLEGQLKNIKYLLSNNDNDVDERPYFVSELIGHKRGIEHALAKYNELMGGE